VGRPPQNVRAFAEALRGRGAGLRVLNLGGGDVDTHTPMGSTAFTVMAALARMDLEITRERITGSGTEPRVAGKNLRGRRQTFTDSVLRLLDTGVVSHPGRPRPRRTPGRLLPKNPRTAGA
jgi:DNA invertase Pin-like site-specific DNA recombinase